MESAHCIKTISIGDRVVVSWLDGDGAILETASLLLVRTDDISDGEIRVSTPLGVALVGSRTGETLSIRHGGAVVRVRIEGIGASPVLGRG